MSDLKATVSRRSPLGMAMTFESCILQLPVQLRDQELPIAFITLEITLGNLVRFKTFLRLVCLFIVFLRQNLTL